MKTKTTDIFDFASKRGYEITEEYDELAQGVIDVSKSHLMLEIGWRGFDMVSYKTFVFKSKYEEYFKILSVTYKTTYRNEIAYIDLSCPFSDHLTSDDIDNAVNTVRLYTTLPSNSQRIYSSLDKIIMFKDRNALFKFLSKDYKWFVEDYRTNEDVERSPEKDALLKTYDKSTSEQKDRIALEFGMSKMAGIF